MRYLKVFLPAGVPLQDSTSLASIGLARHGNFTEHEPLLKTVRWVWVEWFACACSTLSLHDHFFSLTEAVMKLQFEPSGNCDHLCTVPAPCLGLHQSGHMARRVRWALIPTWLHVLADSWLLPAALAIRALCGTLLPQEPMLKTWEWPQGCSVMDRYLCTMQTMLQGLLVTGENQGKTHCFLVDLQ